MRIDKWLWSVRLYKTRTQATEACRNGEVKLNSKTIKASSKLCVSDTINIKRKGFNLVYLVQNTIEKRVSPQLAMECYTDLTPPEELQKFESWYAVKKQSEFREKGAGRPSKKDRRHISEFKNYIFDIEEE